MMHVYDHEKVCLTSMQNEGYCAGGYGLLVEDGEHYKIEFDKDHKKWSLARELPGNTWKKMMKWTAPSTISSEHHSDSSEHHHHHHHHHHDDKDSDSSKHHHHHHHDKDEKGTDEIAAAMMIMNA